MDASAPYVDLEKSAAANLSNHFPVHSRAYAYDYFFNPFRVSDSTPSPKVYGCPVSQFLYVPNIQFPHFNSDKCCNGVKASLVEAQSYYPSHISPAVHNGGSSVAHNAWSPSAGYTTTDGSSLSDYAKISSEIANSRQKGGSGKQFAEFNQGESKQVGLGESFSSMEGNLVNQGCRDVKCSNNREHSTTMTAVPIVTDQLDDKSCWWQTSKSLPVDFSKTSMHGSPLVSSETQYDALLKSVEDSGNHHFSCGASHNKNLKQHDKPSQVDTGFSARITKPIYVFNVGSDAADRDLGGNNLSSKQQYPLPSLGQLDCFGASQFHTQQQRNDPIPTSSTEMSKNISVDVVDFVFKEEGACGFQNPHVAPDNLSLKIRKNEGVNYVANSFDSVDWSNPVFDSPCWKGAPAAHISPFKASEARTPIYAKKTEEYFGCESDLVGPQSYQLNTVNHVKMSSENSNKNQKHNEIEYIKSADPSRKFPVMNFECAWSCDCKARNEQKVNKSAYVAVTDESSQCNGSSDCRVQYPDELSEVRERMPSPTSVGKVPTPDINVHMLIDTMHNLSELLLFHCLNGACELNDQDRNVLKNVISNLDTCTFKNDEQVFPMQESILPQPYTSKCATELPEVHQNASLEKPQSNKLGQECASVELVNPLVEEVKKHHVNPLVEHWRLANSFPKKDDAEMMKEDYMIKALKRTLGENFDDEEEAESQTLLYKNLWLEAEAALCSTNYKACYDQMKTALEKYSYKQRDNALGIKEPSIPEVLPTKQNSATEVNSGIKPNDSTQYWPVLDTANVKESSSFKLTVDLDDSIILEPEQMGSQKPDSFLEHSLVSGTNKDGKGYETSVLAGLHALESQLGDSSISSANTEELLSSEDSQALDSAEKLASGVTSSKNLINFLHGSPIHDKANILKASIMALFHTHKSGAESSSCVCPQGQLSDGAGSGGSGADCAIIRRASESENLNADMDPVMKHLTSSTTVDKSNLKQFDQNVEGTQEIQSRETCRFGNQLRTDDTDSFSSDWEHVEKVEHVGIEFQTLTVALKD